MNAIEIRDLHIEHGEHRLRGASLSVPAGAAVGVVGQDQVELTLLIRACAGFESCERGTIVVDGVDVVQATRTQLLALRQRLGYVSVAGGLLSNMTLRENIELGLRYLGRPPGLVREQVDGFLREFDLLGLADKRAALVPAELRKCAAYLRAVIREPRVFLAEDPSAFLHPEGREMVAQLHQRLRQSGTTVLVADDDEAFVARLTDTQWSILQVAPGPEGPRAPAVQPRVQPAVQEAR